MISHTHQTTRGIPETKVAQRGGQSVFGDGVCICAISAIALLMVWPVGEYAILDDWAFAKSLEHLHDEGRLVVLDWNAMTLIGHLIWGLAFTKVFGFSFFVTKFATFCAGVLLVISVIRFIRSHDASPPVALLAGLSLLLNPLFLAHIFMYMTDVTSLMWQWWALGALGISLRRAGYQSAGWAAVGSLCWGLAFLTRQHGIAVPIAFGIYIILFERPISGRLLAIGSGLVPGALVSVAGNIWQRMSQDPTDAFHVMSNAALNFIRHPLPMDLPFILWSYCVYAGLFVAPIALAVGFRRIMPALRGWSLTGVGVVTAIGVNLFVHYTLSGWYFPYIRNVITPWGMFRPNEFAIQPQTAPVWRLEWGIAIGLVGLVSAIWLMVAVCRSRSSVDEVAPANELATRATRLLLILLMLQAAYTVVTAPFLFDRHLLVFAPTVICLAAINAPVQTRPFHFATVIGLTAYAAYGVICTHDIHAASRGVFLEGTRLIATGVDPEQIDAGYAFDGWFMYERSAKVKTPPLIGIYPWWPTSYTHPTPPSYGSPWWIGGLATQVHPGYVITIGTRIPPEMFEGRLRFEELEGREQVHTYWPYQTQRVRVFRTVPSSETPAI